MIQSHGSKFHLPVAYIFPPDISPVLQTHKDQCTSTLETNRHLKLDTAKMNPGFPLCTA